jgi:hypothetical protein
MTNYITVDLDDYKPNKHNQIDIDLDEYSDAMYDYASEHYGVDDPTVISFKYKSLADEVLIKDLIEKYNLQHLIFDGFLK